MEERDNQAKTYSKYHLPRSKKFGRDYKICGSDKRKYPKKQSCFMCETSATTKPKVVAQLVNEMRMLMKAVIEAVTEKLSKDPNTRVATSQERQAKAGRAQGPSLLKWLLLLGHYRPYLKGKLKGNLPLAGRDMVQNRKKIDPVQEWELPQERTDLSPRKWRLHLPN